MNRNKRSRFVFVMMLVVALMLAALPVNQVLAQPADRPLQTATVITASGTWTAPAGVTQVTVYAWGGGGAGGGVNNGGSEYAGGGGGGGAISVSTVTVVPATGYAVTIGAGGPANSGADGGNGGTTSFAALVTANGGSGGQVGDSGGQGAGGAGGTTARHWYNQVCRWSRRSRKKRHSLL